MKNRLFGIGVGPGDPDLITLKAKRALEKADLIVYPAPENGESLAKGIAISHFPESCEELAIYIPMNTNHFPAMEIYKSASERIYAAVQEEKIVCVLCEGDPFFYGSFMYLFSFLKNRCSIEVIPGVSSIMAGSAILSSPLAAGNDVLTILPAPLSDSSLERQIRLADSFVIIKIGRHFSRVRLLLAKLNLLEKALYIERATMATERIIDITEVDPQTVPYFSIIFVHTRNRAWQ